MIFVGIGFATGDLAQAAAKRTLVAHPVTWTIGTTSLTFTKIVCPTRSVCDAIGSNNRVAKSNDVERHWSDPAIRVSLVGTLDISSATATTCVATVDAGQLGKSPQPPRFLVTHNGNATWQLVAPPSGINGLGPVSCPDARHCVAIATTASDNGEVLHTSDGGSHWSVASKLSAPGVPALFCSSTQFCLRATGGYATTGPIPEVTAVSKNLGTTFASKSTLVSAEQISAMTCASSTHCIAVGSTFTQGVPSRGDGAAYASGTAGRSWTRVSLPKSIAR